MPSVNGLTSLKTLLKTSAYHLRKSFPIVVSSLPPSLHPPTPFPFAFQIVNSCKVKFLSLHLKLLPGIKTENVIFIPSTWIELLLSSFPDVKICQARAPKFVQKACLAGLRTCCAAKRGENVISFSLTINVPLLRRLSCLWNLPLLFLNNVCNALTAQEASRFSSKSQTLARD